MQVVYIVLLILLSILLLGALLLLLAPFTVLLRYDKARGDDGLVASFRLMGFKVWSSTGRKRKSQPGETDKARFSGLLYTLFGLKKRKEETEEKAGEKARQEEKKASPMEYLSFIREAAQIAERFTSKLQVTRLTIHFGVKDEDAAQTAIAYGRISTAIYTALAVLQNKFTLPEPDIAIEACFSGEKPPAKLYVALRSSGYRNLQTLMRLMLLYRKYRHLFNRQA